MLFGKHLNKYYLKYLHFFLLGIISLLIIDVVQLKIPEYLGLAIDNMNNNIPIDTYLWDLVIKTIIVSVIMWVGRFLWRIALFTASNRIQSDLRMNIFDKITRLSRKYFANNRVGELMDLMTYDVEAIHEVVGFGMMSLVDCLFLGGLTIYKMIVLDWKLTLFCILPLILIAFFSGTIEKMVSKRYNHRQKTIDDLSSFTQENFSGIRVIKAFVQEKFEKAYAYKLGKNCKDADVSMTKLSAGTDALVSLLISTTICLILGIGGYFIYMSSIGQMDEIISPGNIVTFVGYFDTLIWPLTAIAYIITIYSKGKTSLTRISKLLDVEDDILDGDDSFDEVVNGEIEFKNLTFAYPDADSPCLKNISFKINAGETIGIVGRLGSGKSTLTDILMRLYNVDNDTVFIDGKDIMNLKVKEIREKIAYVPQDNFLFSDKVKNNIAFSNINADMEEIEKSAILASVHDNIINFDNGYETLTGERGVSLSGGQKQRISIARAFLKNAPIMILDDSVSAVDINTEKDILENVKKQRKGKTTIFIASRVSTVEHLDKILVLNNGGIEGFAPHEELIKISPLYAHMVKIQKFENRMDGDN